MAIHRKLSNGDLEGVAKVAVAALKQAKAQATAPSGSLSITNADGTTTIIGAANETGTTIAAHVGDTEAPGVPTGITATAEGLGATVIWDGTLTGGIPSDFLQVTIYASTTDGETVAGVLSEAGSITVGPYTDGVVVTFSATAEDDVCDEQGNPAHNVSERSGGVAVTIDDRAGHAADSAADAAKSATSAAEMATEAAEAVLATSQHFFSDDAGAHVATTAGEPDTGPNSLWNSEGLLIRDGSNPLTAVTPSGLSVYDGEGTAEDNVVALLSKDTVELGRGNTAAKVSMVDDKARVWAETSDTTSAVFVGTPTANGSSIALTTYDSQGLPSDQGMGISIDTDGTALATVTASKITFNGIVYMPDMSHAKQTFKAAYSGMSFDGNTIELSVTRGIATIRIDVGFKKSGSVAAYGNVLPSGLETAIMSWATPPDGGLQFSFQDLNRTSTWVASLNVTAGKCYLWPTAKFTPTATTHVNGTFTWPVAY
jgi:hypothetical protein